MCLNCFDVYCELVWTSMFLFGVNCGVASVVKMRSDAASMVGLTHVQTLSVADGSDLRVPSSQTR